MFTFVLMRMIAVILLVAANAFFAAGEYALVSIRDTRLEQFIAADALVRARSASCTTSWMRCSTEFRLA